MNTDDIIEKALARVEMAYAELLQVLKDPTVMHNSSSKFIQAESKCSDAVRHLLSARIVIHNAKK